ncbi:MAG: DUF3570 domain-containing protein [Agarilytica sp.]
MAVTKQFFRALATITSIAVCQIVQSAVLPEDRTDLLFHSYEGDNSTFNGPSLLVRKQYKETVSAWANYYIDLNSAASVDVVTQGSKFEEQRDETSLGLDYLHNKTVLSVSATNSSENDYEADSFSLGVSQDFFGDMSTLTMSYSNGKDDIYRNIRGNNDSDPNTNQSDIVGRTYVDSATHKRFGIGWTQIFTKNWIVAFNAEATVDQGFLHNPYRQVRYISSSGGGQIGTTNEPENYPTTRNGQAYAIKSMYYLPWKAALKLEYRTFSDSWQIEAFNYETKYIHPFKEDWIFEFRYRYYEQTQASFYAEIFPFENITGEEFRASDKEMSNFNNTAIGFGLTWEFDKRWIGALDKVTVNLFSDFVSYEYGNYLDKRQSDIRFTPAGGTPLNPGEESAFAFDAQITRFFISIWY